MIHSECYKNTPKKLSTKDVIPGKTVSQNEKEMKTSPGKQKLRESITTRLSYKKC